MQTSRRQNKYGSFASISPHYDRSPEPVASVDRPLGRGPDDDAIDEAADALRLSEIEAALPDLSTLDVPKLEHMSIDELRAVAKALDVPGRAQITEQDELIEEIRRRRWLLDHLRP